MEQVETSFLILEWYSVSGSMFWVPGFVIQLPYSKLDGIDFSNYELVGVDFTEKLI